LKYRKNLKQVTI